MYEEFYLSNRTKCNANRKSTLLANVKGKLTAKLEWKIILKIIKVSLLNEILKELCVFL